MFLASMQLYVMIEERGEHFTTSIKNGRKQKGAPEWGLRETLPYRKGVVLGKEGIREGEGFFKKKTPLNRGRR